MDAASLPLYRLARSLWPRLGAVLALLCLLALLAFAVAGLGRGPGASDGELFSPFRWPAEPTAA